jgi:hypothetical protein
MMRPNPTNNARPESGDVKLLGDGSNTTNSGMISPRQFRRPVSNVNLAPVGSMGNNSLLQPRSGQIGMIVMEEENEDNEVEGLTKSNLKRSGSQR